MAETIGYSTAQDVEPWLMRFLRANIDGVDFYCIPPDTQTTSPDIPACFIYTQARRGLTRVTDEATVGLAYYVGQSETISEAVERMALIIGVATSEAVALASGSPIVMPHTDGQLEFTLAEQATPAHAKPIYYAAVTLDVYRKTALLTTDIY